MKPLRLRYSFIIIIFSIAIVYTSGKFLYNYCNFFAPTNYGNEISIFTKDEDSALMKNPNYMSAVIAYNNKDYGIAIDELNKEIRKYSEHAQAFFLLGKIYEDTEFPEGKYYSRMLSNYEKYIQMKPKGKRVQYVKLKAAQYYIKEGLTQQNVEQLNKAEEYLISLDQNDNNVKMALGAIYLNAKNYDKAIAEFERSANLSPSELKLKYNSLGLAYIKTNSYAKAEKVLEIALKIDPQDKFAHNNLGFVNAQQGKLKDAHVHFTQALSIDPSYKNAEKNLIWVERELAKNLRQ